MSKFTKLSPAGYYHLTWKCQIFLLAIMVFFSSSLRSWVITAPILASLLLMTSLGKFAEKFRLLWITIFISAAPLIAINQIFLIESSVDIATIVIELLVGILPITLLFVKNERAYWLILLNISLIAIGCVVLSNNAENYVLLFCFLLTLVFNLNAAQLFFLTVNTSESNSNISISFFFHFIKVFPIGAVAGALIFFLFPRVPNVGEWFGVKGHASKTGYTGRVSLTGGREISESDNLVFRVQAKDKSFFKSVSVNEILFKGNILDFFDGKTWTGSKGKGYRYTAFRGKKTAKRSSNDLYSLVIYKEPSLSDAIFYPGLLLSISDVAQKVGGILIYDNGDLIRGKNQYDRYAYNLAVSSLPLIEKEGRLSLNAYKKRLKDLNPEIEGIINDTSEVQNVKAPSEILNSRKGFFLGVKEYKKFTQIPKSIGEKLYFKKFINDLTRNEQDLSVSEIVMRLKKVFFSDYQASLVNQFSSADTFEAFLSNDKRGHCEYFATASVLMLRSLGIASRIVLGYRGGVYNEVADLFEVKEKNAHAWVEVFIPDVGWLSFDPTPGLLMADEQNSLSLLKSYMSALSFWFHRNIVNFDRDTQRNLFKSIEEFKLFTFDQNKSNYASVRVFIFPLLLICVLLFLIWYLFITHRRSALYHNLPATFRLFFKRLKKMGIELEQGETLMEFHMRLVDCGLSRGELDKICQTIEAYLYAPEKPSRNSISALKKEIKNMKIEAISNTL